MHPVRYFWYKQNSRRSKHLISFKFLDACRNCVQWRCFRVILEYKVFLVFKKNQIFFNMRITTNKQTYIHIGIININADKFFLCIKTNRVVRFFHFCIMWVSNSLRFRMGSDFEMTLNDIFIYRSVHDGTTRHGLLVD